MTYSDLTLIRLPKLLARRGTSRSAHYRDIAEGIFAPPVRIGARLAAWPRHEVDALIAAEIAGASADQLRKLVRHLVAQRSSLMPSFEAA